MPAITDKPASIVNKPPQKKGRQPVSPDNHVVSVQVVSVAPFSEEEIAKFLEGVIRPADYTLFNLHNSFDQT